MIYCEAILLSILFISLIFIIHSDIINGVIKNKNLFVSSGICVVTNVIYYSFYAKEYFMVFLMNFVVMSIIAILLYAYNIWAAGDSKLFMLILLAIPGRFYFFNYIGIIPGFLLLILIFVFAVFFVVMETIYFFVKNKDWKNINIKFYKIDLKRYICSLLSCSSFVYIINAIIASFFSRFIYENEIFIMAIDFIIILTVINYSVLRNFRVTITIAIICIFFTALRIVPFSYQSINFTPYTFLFITLTIATISEKYNYKEIPTAHIKQGNILSRITIINFFDSKIDGLPKNSTEDLRSRLTKDEVDSIHKWGNSKSGNKTVVIVRKIPFAIFITLGFLAFLFLEVKH